VISFGLLKWLITLRFFQWSIKKNLNRDGTNKRAFPKLLPVDSMEIYSFRQCFDRRVHSTVMQVRHALTWHLPVYLLMISHFFHVLHDSKSIKREASAAAFIRVLLQPRWIALEKKKKQQLFSEPTFRLFYALIISLSLSRTCSYGVCVSETSFHSL